jgi:dihydrofolate synthase/folylpolyglutamate synthase
LYTSPHFIRFNERVQINGKQISDDYIASFVTEHENYIDNNELTFFEVTTALAFKYFLENRTDYCVIETGLGGRLDSTNVLNPLAVVITTISLEHTNVLGNNLGQIALEKAAIIKPNTNVFVGILKPEVEKVITDKCEKTNSQLYRLKDFMEGDKELKFNADDVMIDPVETPLKGTYQKLNAVLAALVVLKTFRLCEQKKYINGLKNVIKNTGIQGRYEYFRKNPTIIFDSAHNSESVTNFLQEFGKEASRYSSKVLLFGAMRDKSMEEMLLKLKPYFDEVVLTEINYERSAGAEDLMDVCNKNNIKATLTIGPSDYVKEFLERDANECLVVLGSIYLLGEVKSKLLADVT